TDRATASARADFPEAVGPTMASGRRDTCSGELVEHHVEVEASEIGIDPVAVDEQADRLGAEVVGDAPERDGEVAVAIADTGAAEVYIAADLTVAQDDVGNAVIAVHH